MVYLNRIYTKTGDDGTTGLGDGTRVAKSHPRIVAYGGVDELNTMIGLARLQPVGVEIEGWLKHIQNDLFDVGADLCYPTPESPPEEPQLRVTAQQVEQLERWIDSASESLQPLRTFVLPGGSPAATYLHLARTVCRRVEISVLRLAEFEIINPLTYIYLNRLSDLLFVLARVCNANGQTDLLWVPGQNR
jgi:cob(I)alamin adenosyltransferase